MELTNSAPSRLDILFGAFVFAGFCLLGLVLAAWLGFRQWLAFKRQCSWCKVRMGGNPLAGHTTHGICVPCLAEAKREIPQPVPVRRGHITATATNH